MAGTKTDEANSKAAMIRSNIERLSDGRGVCLADGNSLSPIVESMLSVDFCNHK